MNLDNNLHFYCHHQNKLSLKKIIDHRKKYIADINLYKNTIYSNNVNTIKEYNF